MTTTSHLMVYEITSPIKETLTSSTTFFLKKPFIRSLKSKIIIYPKLIFVLIQNYKCVKIIIELRVWPSNVILIRVRLPVCCLTLCSLDRHGAKRSMVSYKYLWLLVYRLYSRQIDDIRAAACQKSFTRTERI